MVPVAGFKVIGVVGLGLMGTGIAQVAAMADYDVVALDSEKSLVDRSIARIASSLQRMVEKGIFPETVPENILSRIRGSSDLEAMSDCDLIIEAVYEDYNSNQLRCCYR